jgi:hypothetical protein
VAFTGQENTGQKNQPRKNPRKPCRCSSTGSPRQGSGVRRLPRTRRRKIISLASSSFDEADIAGGRQACPFLIPHIPTGAGRHQRALMALFAATASRLHPIRHPVTLSPQTKKRRIITPQRPLTFPIKHCINIQYWMHAIHPTAPHLLRRLAAGGRVAYRRVPSGAAGVGMCRRRPSA